MFFLCTGIVRMKLYGTNLLCGWDKISSDLYRHPKEQEWGKLWTALPEGKEYLFIPL